MKPDAANAEVVSNAEVVISSGHATCAGQAVATQVPQPQRRVTFATPIATASSPDAEDRDTAAAVQQVNTDWISRQQTAAYQSSAPSVATVAHRIASAGRSAEGQLAVSLTERATAAADAWPWAAPLSYVYGSSIHSPGTEYEQSFQGSSREYSPFASLLREFMRDSLLQLLLGSRQIDAPVQLPTVQSTEAMEPLPVQSIDLTGLQTVQSAEATRVRLTADRHTAEAQLAALLTQRAAAAAMPWEAPISSAARPDPLSTDAQLEQILSDTAMDSVYLTTDPFAAVLQGSGRLPVNVTSAIRQPNADDQAASSAAGHFLVAPNSTHLDRHAGSDAFLSQAQSQAGTQGGRAEPKCSRQYLQNLLMTLTSCTLVV